MKKKLVLGLAVLGTASMLCGFDNTQTANDVLQKTQEASKDAAGVTMTMKMNFDGSSQCQRRVYDLYTSGKVNRWF